ncbi:MAG: ribonuclease III [Terracidiphilus sp.]|jgi:ribonuclease-3
MESDLNELESALGHRFLRPELLVCALTHRSLAHELARADVSIQAAGDTEAAGNSRAAGNIQAAAREDNERLEYLGDAVLGLVVAEALYAAHPEWSEGELTRIRSGLVSRERMAQVAETVGLGKHLRLSRGEERSGLRRKSTVLSNTMEAVMGALYLDGGLEPVRAFVRGQVMGEAAERLADELRSGAALGNYKSALQERLQAARAGAPVYRVKNESGPDHHKSFLVEVRIKSEAGERGRPLARGMGRTKKLAEQDAARRALELVDNAASDVALPSDAEIDAALEEPSN